MVYLIAGLLSTECNLEVSSVTELSNFYFLNVSFSIFPHKGFRRDLLNDHVHKSQNLLSIPLFDFFLLMEIILLGNQNIYYINIANSAILHTML